MSDNGIKATTFKILQRHDDYLNNESINKSSFVRQAIELYRNDICKYKFLRFREIKEEKSTRLVYITNTQLSYLKKKGYKLSIIVYYAIEEHMKGNWEHDRMCD